MATVCIRIDLASLHGGTRPRLGERDVPTGLVARNDVSAV